MSGMARAAAILLCGCEWRGSAAILPCCLLCCCSAAMCCCCCYNAGMMMRTIHNAHSNKKRNLGHKSNRISRSICKDASRLNGSVAYLWRVREGKVRSESEV